MLFQSIRWRIAFTYVVLILLVMAGLTLYFTGFVRQTHIDGLQAQLKGETQLLGGYLEEASVAGQPTPDYDQLAKRWARLAQARVTIVAQDGTVIGESDQDRTTMDNHLSRPEIQEALVAGWGSSVRYSQTLGYNMLYGAKTYAVGSQGTGIVRLALPLQRVETEVSVLRRNILLATALAALLAILIGIAIAERTVGPVHQLTNVVNRMAQGNLDARLFPTTRDEVGHLTRSFNSMAEQLQDQIATLGRERTRLAAVLEYMADGVLIVDGQGRVQLVNPAAARMLGTTQKTSLGHSFVQVVRDHRLVEVWQRCTETGEEQIAEVEVDRENLSVRIIVTPLREPGTQGNLVMLQDLTQIHHLEIVRRDFVSNISHELRTPLASLKALVDTLRDGALDDRPAAEHFLDSIEIEVDALTQMVQELLELARIESGQVPVRLRPTALADLINPPVERLSSQAERAGVRMTVSLAPDLPMVLADPERVQQVITNLVHNAIKFTPAEGSIVIAAETAPREVIVKVSDTGVGIAPKDLPRVFERFYKTDRARSSGGTGLGLAIARHIVQAHGGRIWAKSVEGEGSTFFFSLPTAYD
jgi:two-component system, OmpR family, phosphate regulon sensor histidine kinase PhoR